jgi:hypothetical protein
VGGPFFAKCFFENLRIFKKTFLRGGYFSLKNFWKIYRGKSNYLRGK